MAVVIKYTPSELITPTVPYYKCGICGASTRDVPVGIKVTRAAEVGDEHYLTCRKCVEILRRMLPEITWH